MFQVNVPYEVRINALQSLPFKTRLASLYQFELRLQ